MLVWFGLSNWDGQVGFVMSGPVSLVGIVESRWIGQFLVKMV